MSLCESPDFFFLIKSMKYICARARDRESETNICSIYLSIIRSGDTRAGRRAGNTSTKCLISLEAKQFNCFSKLDFRLKTNVHTCAIYVLYIFIYCIHQCVSGNSLTLNDSVILNPAYPSPINCVLLCARAFRSLNITREILYTVYILIYI